jgi:hypothetical protein
MFERIAAFFKGLNADGANEGMAGFPATIRVLPPQR